VQTRENLVTTLTTVGVFKRDTIDKKPKATPTSGLSHHHDMKSSEVVQLQTAGATETEACELRRRQGPFCLIAASV